MKNDLINRIEKILLNNYQTNIQQESNDIITDKYIEIKSNKQSIDTLRKLLELVNALDEKLINNETESEDFKKTLNRFEMMNAILNRDEKLEKILKRD